MHMNVPVNQDELKCSHCPKTFSYSRVMKKHKKKKIGFKCKQCPKTFKEKLTLDILAIASHSKDIQMFVKVLNMVERCGEQFCKQVLLSGPLCCQKLLDSTTKSDQLYALSIFIYVPQNQFFLTLIKTRTILQIF